MNANAFMANRFDLIDIVPMSYAIFAMALGICAGILLRRTVPALGVTLAVFVGVRAFVAQWLRLHYMTPIIVSYKFTSNSPSGAYLGVSQASSARTASPAIGNNGAKFNGVSIPAECQNSNNIASSWRRTATGGT